MSVVEHNFIHFSCMKEAAAGKLEFAELWVYDK